MKSRVDALVGMRAEITSDKLAPHQPEHNGRQYEPLSERE